MLKLREMPPFSMEHLDMQWTGMKSKIIKKVLFLLPPICENVIWFLVRMGCPLLHISHAKHRTKLLSDVKGQVFSALYRAWPKMREFEMTEWYNMLGRNWCNRLILTRTDSSYLHQRKISHLEPVLTTENSIPRQNEIRTRSQKWINKTTV